MATTEPSGDGPATGTRTTVTQTTSTGRDETRRGRDPPAVCRTPSSNLDEEGKQVEGADNNEKDYSNTKNMDNNETVDSRSDNQGGSIPLASDWQRCLDNSMLRLKGDAVTDATQNLSPSVPELSTETSSQPVVPVAKLVLPEASSEQSNNDDQQNNDDKRPLPLSPLSITGIVLICMCLLFVVIAAVKTNASYLPSNPNGVEDGDMAVYTGGVGLGLFVVSIPVQFLAGQSYLRAKKQNSNVIGPCLGITSWLLYASCAINGIFLVSVGASDDPEAYVAPSWVLGTGFWGFASWLFMFFWSEKARKL